MNQEKSRGIHKAKGNGIIEIFPVTKKRAEWTRIIVCFADIRGFTRFAGRKGARINDILSCFFEALNSAFNRAIANLKGESKFRNRILKLAYPTARKALGDGAMLVWEYPQSSRTETVVDMGFALWILDFVAYLQEDFGKSVEKLNLIQDLDLGVGLSCGFAWKVCDLGSSLVDYVGTPVNVAARLQDKARPRGLVADLELAPFLFMERCCFGEGVICQESLKGIVEKTPVWAAKKTIHRRSPKNLDTLESTLEFLSIRSNSMPPDQKMPLEEADTELVFGARETFEGKFVADLAKRVRKGQVLENDLRPIKETIHEMENLLVEGMGDLSHGPRKEWNELGVAFHTRIAELSDGNQRLKRREFTERIYNFTRQGYAAATSVEDLEAVLAEHRDIFDAIKSGNPEEAKSLMNMHLKGHFGREKSSLLKAPPDCEGIRTR